MAASSSSSSAAPVAGVVPLPPDVVESLESFARLAHNTQGNIDAFSRAMSTILTHSKEWKSSKDWNPGLWGDFDSFEKVFNDAFGALQTFVLDDDDNADHQNIKDDKYLYMYRYWGDGLGVVAKEFKCNPTVDNRNKLRFNALMEAFLLHVASTKGAAPKITFMYKTSLGGFGFHMEECAIDLYGILQDEAAPIDVVILVQILRGVYRTLTKKLEGRLLHGDLHLENIMFNPNEDGSGTYDFINPYIIDMERAVYDGRFRTEEPIRSGIDMVTLRVSILGIIERSLLMTLPPSALVKWEPSVRECGEYLLENIGKEALDLTLTDVPNGRGEKYHKFHGLYNLSLEEQTKVFTSDLPFCPEVLTFVATMVKQQKRHKDPSGGGAVASVASVASVAPVAPVAPVVERGGGRGGAGGGAPSSFAASPPFGAFASPTPSSGGAAASSSSALPRPPEFAAYNASDFPPYHGRALVKAIEYARETEVDILVTGLEHILRELVDEPPLVLGPDPLGIPQFPGGSLAGIEAAVAAAEESGMGLGGKLPHRKNRRKTRRNRIRRKNSSRKSSSRKSSSR